MVYGVWCMVYGVLCMVHGSWFKDHWTVECGRMWTWELLLGIRDWGSALKIWALGLVFRAEGLDLMSASDCVHSKGWTRLRVDRLGLG